MRKKGMNILDALDALDVKWVDMKGEGHEYRVLYNITLSLLHPLHGVFDGKNKGCGNSTLGNSLRMISLRSSIAVIA